MLIFQQIKISGQALPKRKDPNSDGYVVAPSGHMTTNNILRAGELEGLDDEAMEKLVQIVNRHMSFAPIG